MTASPDSEAPDPGVYRRYVAYFAEHRTAVLITLAAMVFVALANSLVALAGKLVMDLFTAISTGAAGTPTIHLAPEISGHRLFTWDLAGLGAIRRALWMVALGTIALVLVKGVVHFCQEYLVWRTTHRILMRIKSELFQRIVNLPSAFFDREKSGEVLSRVTYDVTQMEGSIRSGFILLKSAVSIVIFVTAMFLMEWSLTLFVIAVFPLSALIIKIFGERIRRASGKVSQNVADYTAFLNEALGGARIIKAFGRQKDMLRAFEVKIRENYRWSMKVAKYATLHWPSQDVFASIGMAGVVIFCGYRLLSGRMTLGDLTGFLILLNFSYQPIKMLGETNTIFQRALASGKQIFKLLNEPDEAAIIGSGSHRPDVVQGELTFTDVRFAYRDDTQVLKGINLKIAAGETVALVGPSGGGKSTLVSLIPRFYPLREGRIAVDGVSIAEWDLNYLRSQIAVVPQETILFSGSIEENIRFGNPNASIDEVIAAAEAAYIHDFIDRLHAGYRAEVGERGVQLSGGQRQRIALARAILRNPRILLLDEATSALDSESEHLIQEALEKFRRNRTTVIIAHRLATVQSADRIAVIDDGRLVELGTHRQLYDAGALYRRLCDQQLMG